MPGRWWPLYVLILVLPGGCDALDDVQVSALSALADLIETDSSTELPASRDRDGDGLTNEEEDELGTEHGDPDTDGDGQDDLRELETGTDPTVPNQDQTVDGVPPAFDGVLQPGQSRVFFRGAAAPYTAYLRLMGLVRSQTRVSVQWQEIVENEPVTVATSLLTFDPGQYWCWGHDVGGPAVIVDPESMTVTQLEVTVLTGGDSIAYSFISSGGLLNGPRGFVPFPQELAEADLNVTLLMAHGLADEAGSWDSFAFMAERISDGINVIRTDVEPTGSVAERAGELARFIQREDPENVYAIGHSMGGLDLRYILTKAAAGDPAFVGAGDAIVGVYTIATPHWGALMASLVEEFPEFTDFVDLTAPAIMDLEPGSAVLDYLNDSFDGDVTIDGRVVPVVALAFHAGEPSFPASDGVVDVASQSFGSHVIGDVPSTRGAGLGGGKHIPLVPTRADVELHSYEVLGRILADIVARQAESESSGG